MPQKPPPQNVPDGWEVVEDTAPVAAGAPEGWELVEDAEKPTNAMGLVSAATAAGAAAVPVVRGLAARLASPALGATAGALAARVAGPLNVGTAIYRVASGKESLPRAAVDAAVGEGARRFFRPERMVQPAVRAVQRLAAPVANALGAEGVVGAAPVAVPLAGGLAGVAGTAGFLGALQHDANRNVQIDYSKRTPDTDIARVLMNMRNSEANRGRSLEERMDDPNDVMFQADDSATVRGAQPSLLQRLALLAGLR